MHAAQLDVAGGEVALGPRATLTLALVLHELATNAAKHGAFSVPEGHVALAWQVAGDGSGPVLHLSWRETGGPAVALPSSRRGFGRTLLELAVAYELGGSARLDFPPEGVAYTLEAPLGEAEPRPADGTAAST
jgi:two-component sensor histidine kinase